jgi:pimeloyl-ACP methyl ester carboxylesterase
MRPASLPDWWRQRLKGKIAVNVRLPDSLAPDSFFSSVRIKEAFLMSDICSPSSLAGPDILSDFCSLAIADSVFRWLTRPTPGAPDRTPSSLNLPWERLECRTADGLQLIGWVVSPPLARATLLLCHGLRQNRSWMLERIAFLASAGYRCITFDHRAHGQSDGRRTSFGYCESLDVSAALGLIRERWSHQPMAAMGISLGGAALCHAAAHTGNCGAIILESLYHDIGRVLVLPPTLEHLRRRVEWLTQRWLGVPLARLAPAEAIGALAPVPIFLVTGTENSYAPPPDVRRLYQRCPGPRELWLVPRAAHDDVCVKGGMAYQERVLSFLERWLFRGGDVQPLAA